MPLALAIVLCTSGCATYSDKTAAARSAANAGNYEGALAGYNKFLGVKEAAATPDDIDSDTALGLLERGSVLQALDEFELSARDYGLADKELDLLDLGGDAAGEIGRYVYSDSATRYRSQPTEKLALNGMNMLNYLALGDVAGARVEARRFTTMQQYLKDYAPDRAHGSFGSYLAGFVFERLGQPRTALRYYDDVLQHGSPRSLREPVGRLARQSDYRGAAIGDFLASSAAPPSTPSDWGDVLIVVNAGRVPYKIPERMPVGQAVGIAGVFVTGDLSVLQYTAAKYVVYPKLVAAPQGVTSARARVGETDVSFDLVSDLGREVQQEYESLKPKILGAAISRLIARAAVAEGVRAAGRQQNDALGAIAALIAEATLVALDKPDTRSWTLLPDRVLIARTRVPPGTHVIELGLSGPAPATRHFSANVEPGGFAVLVATVLR